MMQLKMRDKEIICWRTKTAKFYLEIGLLRKDDLIRYLNSQENQNDYVENLIAISIFKIIL